ncbi:MAG: hypothetical protein JKY50_10830 [Oleispira sp.]|nr:hypothetical protein [Oleispira sp.]MBL4880871.1 hypothetical protein [Oleispira sp.]
MSDVEILVKALEQLKPETNIFKDYIYPIVAPFFATLLGAWAGYHASVRKQKRDYEVDRLVALNRILLQAESCFSNLESIKENYRRDIDSSPLRGISFGPLVLDFEKASTDVSKLIFLTKTLSKTTRDIDETRLAFNNLPRLKQILHNYNQVLAIWHQRNVEVKPIFDALREHAVAGVVEGDVEELFKVVDRENIALVCHLSEKAIKLTDDGLKEFLGLMQELPDLARPCFQKKFLTEEGGIVSYLNDPNIIGQIISRVPDLDSQASIRVFGADLSAK